MKFNININVTIWGIGKILGGVVILVVGKILISENLDVGNLPTPPNDSPDRDDSKKKIEILIRSKTHNGV